MHMIETLFGISPDGGSGMTEFGLLFGLLTAAVVLSPAGRLLLRRLIRGRHAEAKVLQPASALPPRNNQPR